MKNFILLIILFFNFELCKAQDFAGPADDSVTENSVFIGFSKASSQEDRMRVLSSAPGTVMEELDILDYPVYRIELDKPVTNELIETIQNRFKTESFVLFVTNKKNLDEQQSGSTVIARQGNMSIAKTNLQPDKESSVEYRQIILNHMPGLNICVEKHSSGKGGKKVKALYEIDVDAKGSVRNVRLLESNIKHPELRKCLKQKISSWRDFPRRRGSEDITLKFKFNY